jgi:hypothetical protein
LSRGANKKRFGLGLIGNLNFRPAGENIRFYRRISRHLGAIGIAVVYSCASQIACFAKVAGILPTIVSSPGASVNLIHFEIFYILLRKYKGKIVDDAVSFPLIFNRSPNIIKPKDFIFCNIDAALS